MVVGNSYSKAAETAADLQKNGYAPKIILVAYSDKHALKLAFIHELTHALVKTEGFLDSIEFGDKTMPYITNEKYANAKEYIKASYSEHLTRNVEAQIRMELGYGMETIRDSGNGMYLDELMPNSYGGMTRVGDIVSSLFINPQYRDEVNEYFIKKLYK